MFAVIVIKLFLSLTIGKGSSLLRAEAPSCQPRLHAYLSKNIKSISYRTGGSDRDGKEAALGALLSLLCS